MKSFIYTARDEYGLHARPAGLLVKEAAKFKSTVSLSKGDKKADCKRLFNVMALAIKKGDTIVFTMDGPDEEEAAVQLEAFCKNNF